MTNTIHSLRRSTRPATWARCAGLPLAQGPRRLLISTVMVRTAGRWSITASSTTTSPSRSKRLPSIHHGGSALIEPGTPVLACVPVGLDEAHMLTAAGEGRARRVDIIGVDR